MIIDYNFLPNLIRFYRRRYDIGLVFNKEHNTYETVAKVIVMMVDIDCIPFWSVILF